MRRRSLVKSSPLDHHQQQDENLPKKKFNSFVRDFLSQVVEVVQLPSYFLDFSLHMYVCYYFYQLECYYESLLCFLGLFLTQTSYLYLFNKDYLKIKSIKLLMKLLPLAPVLPVFAWFENIKLDSNSFFFLQAILESLPISFIGSIFILSYGGNHWILLISICVSLFVILTRLFILTTRQLPPSASLLIISGVLFEFGKYTTPRIIFEDYLSSEMAFLILFPILFSFCFFDFHLAQELQLQNQWKNTYNNLHETPMMLTLFLILVININPILCYGLMASISVRRITWNISSLLNSYLTTDNYVCRVEELNKLLFAMRTSSTKTFLKGNQNNKEEIQTFIRNIPKRWEYWSDTLHLQRKVKYYAAISHGSDPWRSLYDGRSPTIWYLRNKKGDLFTGEIKIKTLRVICLCLFLIGMTVLLARVLLVLGMFLLRFLVAYIMIFFYKFDENSFATTSGMLRYLLELVIFLSFPALLLGGERLSFALQGNIKRIDKLDFLLENEEFNTFLVHCLVEEARYRLNERYFRRTIMEFLRGKTCQEIADKIAEFIEVDEDEYPQLDTPPKFGF